MITDDDIDEIAKTQGLPPAYLRAILGKENSKDSDVSNAGAIGKGQLLPTTFKSVYPEGDINDPYDNVTAAARYLKQGLDKNGGDFQKAAAYYYAGPNWQKKVQAAPGKKYGGTKPDPNNPQQTLDGISIEDYSQQASQLLAGLPMTSDSSSPASAPTLPTNAPDPGQEILRLTGLADQQLQEVQKTNLSTSEQIRKNIQTQMEKIRQGGELNATVKLDEFQQASARAGEAAAELSRLGINLSDTDSAAAKISESYQADLELSQQMRADIDAKRSVNPIDDPLQWIVNQFTLNSDIKQHNAVIGRMRSQKAYIENASSMAASLAQANAAKFTAISLTGANAAAEFARNEAEVKALESQDKLLRNDYNMQVQTLNVLQQRISNLNQLQNSELTQENKRQLMDQRTAAAEKVKADDKMVQTAGMMLGMNIQSRKSLETMAPDVQKAVEYVMSNGGGIGKDPYEALQVLKRGDPAKMPPIVKTQLDLLNATTKEVIDGLQKDPLFKAAKGKEREEAVSRGLANKWNMYSVNPNKSVRNTFDEAVDNPYHIPSRETMSALPAARQLPINKIIEDHHKALPNLPLTDTLIKQLAYQNIGEGKAYKDVIEAARDLSAYYKAGVDYNNQYVKFTNFGMPEQTSYPVDKVDYSSYPSVLKDFILKQQQEYATNVLAPQEMLLRSSPTGGQ